MGGRADRRLAVVESVVCLECGTRYAKPAGGGTVEANPGCPACGYVGWIPGSVPVTPPFVPPRFVADLRLRRSAQ